MRACASLLELCLAHEATLTLLSHFTQTMTTALNQFSVQRTSLPPSGELTSGTFPQVDGLLEMHLWPRHLLDTTRLVAMPPPKSLHLSVKRPAGEPNILDTCCGRGELASDVTNDAVWETR